MMMLIKYNLIQFVLKLGYPIFDLFVLLDQIIGIAVGVVSENVVAKHFDHF